VCISAGYHSVYVNVCLCVSPCSGHFFVCVIRVNVFSVWVCPCLYVETHSCMFLEIFEDAYWYLYVCACVSLCLWFPWCCVKVSGCVLWFVCVLVCILYLGSWVYVSVYV